MIIQGGIFRMERCAGCTRMVCNDCKNIKAIVAGSKAERIHLPECFVQRIYAKTGYSNGKEARLEVCEIHENKYGAAFDIGTTTVAGMLWDMDSGIQKALCTAGNPQVKYGADVIARIKAGLEDEDVFGDMNKLIVSCMDEMIKRMQYEAGAISEDETGRKEKEGYSGEKYKSRHKINSIVIAGNPTMTHLAAGLRVDGLARAPFTSDYQGILLRKGEELGLDEAKEAEVFILPGIAGHVGSDMAAVLAYTEYLYNEGYYHSEGDCHGKSDSHSKSDSHGKSDCHSEGGNYGRDDNQDKGSYLVLDIGTNGEIALCKGADIYVCSTAAGPALEGGGVTFGMRAAAGAIAGVKIIDSNDSSAKDIELQVIGQADAVGICGSGLIDMLDALFKLGIIDETGYMRSSDEVMELHGSNAVACRIIDWYGERAFRIAGNEETPIVITASDIRQLQLAKGAIRAGIEILLAKQDVKLNDIKRIYIAGAFGNSISPLQAISIGLIPEVNKEVVVPIGNGAGIGASMALLSEECREQIEEKVRKAIHVELAQEKQFQEKFLRYLNIKDI